MKIKQKSLKSTSLKGFDCQQVIIQKRRLNFGAKIQNRKACVNSTSLKGFDCQQVTIQKSSKSLKMVETHTRTTETHTHTHKHTPSRRCAVIITFLTLPITIMAFGLFGPIMAYGLLNNYYRLSAYSSAGASSDMPWAFDGYRRL